MHNNTPARYMSLHDTMHSSHLARRHLLHSTLYNTLHSLLHSTLCICNTPDNVLKWHHAPRHYYTHCYTHYHTHYYTMHPTPFVKPHKRLRDTMPLTSHDLATVLCPSLRPSFYVPSTPLTWPSSCVCRMCSLKCVLYRIMFSVLTLSTTRYTLYYTIHSLLHSTLFTTRSLTGELSQFSAPVLTHVLAL